MFTILLLATLLQQILSQTNNPHTTALPETGGGATASAGDLAALPACAQLCLGNSTTSQGSCASEDIQCLCSNDNYVQVLSCCVATKCNSVDQDSAASFNTQLCSSVNVTLPNYLGCANGENVGSGNSPVPSFSSVSGLATSGAAGNGTATTKKATPVGTIESQLSLIVTGAVATYSGGKLLTGSCSEPQLASMTLPAGRVLEYPWLGCSEVNLGCCPFNPNSGGPLSVCPADYVTTSGACCPSGWSKYTSAFAGSTPCVTSALVPFVTISSTRSPAISVTVITNELFTFRYPLATTPTKLSPGAIAGIAIGSISGLALILAAAALLLRQHRFKAHAKRRAATISQSETNTKGLSELDPTSPHDNKGGHSELPSPRGDDKKGVSELSSPHNDKKAMMSELPSPHSPILPERAFHTPTSPSGRINEVFEMAAAAPAEMEGDVFLDENHPAHVGQSPVSIGEKRLGGSANVMGLTNEGIQGEEDEEEPTPAYSPTSGKMLSLVADEPYVDDEDKYEEGEEGEKVGR
ncbi:hypothetical protein N7G274_006288 [Stereocaulon virgatum]|uniref:CFEM domain-containing protein n=1 Tax=Stereocaulon virgatum TaxID=373712 RepID=A0ABR4A6Y0_9LECA